MLKIVFKVFYYEKKKSLQGFFFFHVNKFRAFQQLKLHENNLPYNPKQYCFY